MLKKVAGVLVGLAATPVIMLAQTAPDPAADITTATTSAAGIVNVLIPISIVCVVAGLVFKYARKASK